MFAVQSDEDHQAPLVLTDIKQRTFLSVLEFIYGNSCNLTDETAVEVMAASIEYGLDGLTKVCLPIANYHGKRCIIAVQIRAALFAIPHYYSSVFDS